ncbi:MAG: YcxB family protein [Lachnospiraceae bacterium]
MKEKIQVQMTKKALFDFMLYHTYSKLSGFLTNILGVAVGFMGIILFFTEKISIFTLLFYIVAMVIFVGYTPVLIYYRAHKQMMRLDIYKNMVEYTFDESNGITVLQDKTSVHYDWTQFEKVVVTPKTIGIYYGTDQAFIIPKEDFSNCFVPIMNMVMFHIRPRKNMR